MDQIPIRVLNQDTAGVLARVERGETVEITNRGKPVARLVPVVEGELDDLIAQGRVVPATIHGPFPMPTVKVEDNAASAALIAMREEERW
ncbi:type II toxin-antitoxin system Phd/YefM family antitoxin [Actinocrispum wychmicini]|uniref:Antitoxin n=1 Tax=Actinocrispum wychmicini TaxID=1213861 RepID=A0A4R2K606_9PSEU|nr:type II toxin-antitoxin system prevent-host-death family antitoxin [Actinocrispum wychmicini]TCO65326.1 prevent-host-death family protein [Actinocrispum wychmicini]